MFRLTSGNIFIIRSSGRGGESGGGRGNRRGRGRERGVDSTLKQCNETAVPSTEATTERG